MQKLNQKQIDEIRKLSYKLWYEFYAQKNLDQLVEGFLEMKSSSHFCWIKSMRQGLYLSTTEMAMRLKVNKSTYLKYESSEAKKTISIHSLEKVAQAMDCDLIYGLRPKSKILPSKIIWTQVSAEGFQQFEKVRRYLDASKANTAYEAMIFKNITLRKESNPKLRKAKGWKRNPNWSEREDNEVSTDSWLRFFQRRS